MLPNDQYGSGSGQVGKLQLHVAVGQKKGT